MREPTRPAQPTARPHPAGPAETGAPALSAAQRRLWLAYKVEPDSAEFTAPWALRVRGALDVDVLARAWRAVLARHGELRLRVSEHAGEPRRDAWPVDRMGLRVREIGADSLEGELQRAAGRVFDLLAEPLVELEVLRLAADEHVLVCSAHHIVIDGRSIQLVIQDLFGFYTGEPVSRDGADYAGYVRWESTAAARPADDRIAGWIDDLRLPTPERPLGFGAIRSGRGKRGETIRLALEPRLWDMIRHTARAHRTTPQVVGMTALALTLRGYTGDNDVILGGTMDTRPSAFVDTVGMFINPVPIRLRLPDEQDVADLYGAAQRALLRAHAHRHLPFEDLVRRLNLTPDGTRSPLFQVLFNYQPQETCPEVAGLEITSVDLPSTVSKYDLTVVLRQLGDAAELVAVYPADRYRATQLRQFTAHLRTVLAALATGAVRATGTVQMLGHDETAELLALGCGAPVPADPVPVHALVARLARQSPDRVAVVCGEDSVSYRELHDWAGAIAGQLAGCGIGRGSRVGVLAERSAAMIAAVLGTLRAGAAYVPLDPAHPAERRAAVLGDAGVSGVLSTAGMEHRCGGMHLPVLRIEAARGRSAPFSDVAVGPQDAAYVIYTSGTSGAPKGVVVEHGQLAASTSARRLLYPEDAVFLLVSPLAFDSSAAGLWGSLTSGSRLVVAGTADIRDPERLLGLIARHQVTQLLWVPSLYEVVLAAARRRGLDTMRSIRRVMVAGEPLPDALLREHFAALGPVELVNEYGPTETTVWASLRRYHRAEPVDIGGPIPGARLYVLDSRRQLVPRGVAGELYVGGAGVSRGYLGRPAETAQAFGPDPFAPVPGARMYRTGDRVRWTARGTLEFLGRTDQQIKIRGYRVELGAVEAALRACAGVRDAVIVPVAQAQQLVGFVTADQQFDQASTRKRLAELLPEPMVPASLRVLDAFPSTANGKVDRDALAEQAVVQPPPDPAGSGPRDELTALVSAAWSEVLGLPTVPLEANFFDVGGHSLLVPSLQAALQRRAGVRVSVVELFSSTTVRAQAALARDAAGTAGPAAGPATGPAAGTAAAPGGAGSDPGGRRTRAAQARSRRVARAGEAR